MDDELSNIEVDPQKLELALREENVSQADLARVVGFPHRNTVTKILRGQRQMTANDLLRVAAALNRSPQDFAKA